MLVGALVLGWAFVSYYQPFTGDGEGTVAVRIPNGASVSLIAEILDTRGVISSPFFFETRARLTDRGTTLQAERSGGAADADSRAAAHLLESYLASSASAATVSGR